MLLFRG
jgi:hypothetical protein